MGKSSDKREKLDSEASSGGGFAAYKQEILFLVVFGALLAGSFTLISLNWVNDQIIEPFTAVIAKASGLALNLLGQDIRMDGTKILSPRFSVNILNGCNGVETLLIFCSAVISFPATWKSRLKGLVFGGAAIQVVNLVRVVALYLTGAYFPKFFDTSHTVVWQTLVILAGVLLWIYWANRFAVRRPAEA